LLVAGTLALTTTAVTGFEPARPTELPDTAFHAVTLPSQAPSALPTPARTADDGVLLDLQFASPPPGRAQPSLKPPAPVVVSVAPPTTHAIRGYASWYCRAGVSPCTAGYSDGGGFQAYAAAGPRLRAALGNWRGRIVYVDGIRVQLIDWCQCYEGQSNEKLLDLYYDVFARTGSPVTIRW
jgi:hypothetical protein